MNEIVARLGTAPTVLSERHAEWWVGRHVLEVAVGEGGVTVLADAKPLADLHAAGAWLRAAQALTGGAP